MLLSASTVSAGVYEFTIEGEVTSVLGTVPGPRDSVQVGAPYSFMYAVDSDTPDVAGSPFTGLYAVLSLEVTIDGVAQATTVGEVRVVANSEYSILAWNQPMAVGIGLKWLNPLPGTLVTDDLPLNLDPGDWLFTNTKVVGRGGSWRLDGDVQTFESQIVPAPPVLAATGIWLLGRRCLRQRDQKCTRFELPISWTRLDPALAVLTLIHGLAVVLANQFNAALRTAIADERTCRVLHECAGFRIQSNT